MGLPASSTCLIQPQGFEKELLDFPEVPAIKLTMSTFTQPVLSAPMFFPLFLASYLLIYPLELSLHVSFPQGGPLCPSDQMSLILHVFTAPFAYLKPLQ